MTVYHILKDGRRVESVKGHVVDPKDNPTLYTLMANLRKTKDRRVKA